jgi:Holliday junction resolvase RusA-like endonuclease
MRIDIKPLSVNDAWQGRRFKTASYLQYERALMLLLPNFEVPEGKLKLEVTFGITTLGDWDNPIKPFVDVLQKKWNFNDNRIMRAIVDKVVVKKGEEFISFSLTSL